MALTIAKIGDLDANVGPDYKIRGFSLTPGTSDYVTGGYPLTAGVLGFYALWGGYQIGVNAAGALYLAQFVPNGTVPIGNASSTGTTVLGYIFVSESSSAAGVFTQVANGGNLTGVVWNYNFIGY